MKKLGLTIGINYNDLTKNKLNGCINDAKNMKKQLERYGYSVRLMTDDPNMTPSMVPNKENIIRELRSILQRAEDGDHITITFAGHGDQFSSTDGTELDGKDETILAVGAITETVSRVPVLNKRGKMLKGYTGRNITRNGFTVKINRLNVISDNEINRIIWEELQGRDNENPLKPNCRLFLLFDCCHSGTVGDLKYNYDVKKSRTNRKAKEIAAKVILISGCRDNQVSADAKFNGSFGGAMTYSLIRSLNLRDTARSLQDNIFDLVQQMREFINENNTFGQVPQISSSFDLKSPNNNGDLWFIHTRNAKRLDQINNSINNSTNNVNSVNNIKNSRIENTSNNTNSQVNQDSLLEQIKQNIIGFSQSSVLGAPSRPNRPNIPNRINQNRLNNNQNPPSNFPTNSNPQIVPTQFTSSYNNLARPNSNLSSVFSYTYRPSSSNLTVNYNSPYSSTYVFNYNPNRNNTIYSYTYRNASSNSSRNITKDTSKDTDQDGEVN